MSPDGDYATTEIRTADGRVVLTDVRCLHAAAHVEPVVSGGVLVAHLCTDCDTQLSAVWKP